MDCFIYNNKYILWLRRNHRKWSKLILLLTSPYLLLNWATKACYAKCIGKWDIAKKIKKEMFQTFKHEIAIVAIAKNEGLYLKEWIGFMAFIDLNEYIMPENAFEPIGEIVNRVLSKRHNAAGIALNWCIYGNSGYKTRPNGLITESYIDRAAETNPMNHMIKTLCNPRLVHYYISPHYPQYKLGAISVDSTGLRRSKGWFCRNLTFKNIRLNQYFCKSEEDFKIKKGRGLGDRVGSYDFTKYNSMNFNEIHDKSMLTYRDKLYKATK